MASAEVMRKKGRRVDDTVDKLDILKRKFGIYCGMTEPADCI